MNGRAPIFGIRPMRDADLGVVAGINAACVPEVGEADLPMLADLLSISAVALVADTTEGEVVGFCIALPPGTDYDSPNYRYFEDRLEDHVYLDRIAVVASHRGLGIGAELHRELERATDAAIVSLEINVDPPNEASMRFHAGLGFVEMERLETRPGKPVSLQVRRRDGARSR